MGPMIVGISGICTDDDGNSRAMGAGKDTVADHLIAKHRFVRVSLADHIKRICKDVFRFTDEQLWGSLEQKNAADFRYPSGAEEYRKAYREWKEKADSAASAEEAAGFLLQANAYARLGWLTPRRAMTLLGTEWGRACYHDVWVEGCMYIAKLLLKDDYITGERLWRYSPQHGLSQRGDWSDGSIATWDLVFDPAKTNLPKGVVIPDVRFKNEYDGIKAAGGRVIRVRRRVKESCYEEHRSETEVTSFPDEKFDYILDNSGTIAGLGLLADRMLDVFTGRIMEYDAAQEDVPPYLRKRQ